MSSDIYAGCFNSDNLVGLNFTPFFDQHYPYDDFLLRSVSAGPPLVDLPPSQLHDPLQEPLVFSSYYAGYGDAEGGSMQRSYSSNCMGTGGGCDRGEGIIWRVYSAGDLTRRGDRYSAEERKERIRKYREKRNLRNFNKTIKYACRKTLADSRPRIRGRFVRNDEVVGDGDTSNDNTITIPTLHRLDHDHNHHPVVVSSSPLWEWNDTWKEENYGCVNGGDGLLTTLFLPQNYYY